MNSRVLVNHGRHEKITYLLFHLRMNSTKKSNSKSQKSSLAAQVNALTNQVRQMSANAEKHGGNAKPKKRAAKKSVDAPAAAPSRRLQVGVSSRGRETVSWIAGQTYVGNGVLGITDQVYFRPAGASTTILVAATGTVAQIPIAGSDSIIGTPYLNEVSRRYVRKRIYGMTVSLMHILSSTANDATCCLAPIAGCGNSAATSSTTGFATAGANLATLESLEGNKPAAAWQDCHIDMTRYIRGGAGAKQNEFNISSTGNTATVIGSGVDQEGSVPACFVVGGNSTTVALRGQAIHNVVITQELEFIDWIGASTVTDAVAFLSADVERANARLRSHIECMSKMPEVVPCCDTPSTRVLGDLKRQYCAEGKALPSFLK